MTPASNSEARKRVETPEPSVLVELPVDLAGDLADLLNEVARPTPQTANQPAGVKELLLLPADTVTAKLAAQRIADALDARVSDTPIGDRVRPDAAGWAGRH